MQPPHLFTVTERRMNDHSMLQSFILGCEAEMQTLLANIRLSEKRKLSYVWSILSSRRSRSPPYQDHEFYAGTKLSTAVCLH